jgi:hypothetical protein
MVIDENTSDKIIILNIVNKYFNKFKTMVTVDKIEYETIILTCYECEQRDKGYYIMFKHGDVWKKTDTLTKLLIRKTLNTGVTDNMNIKDNINYPFGFLFALDTTQVVDFKIKVGKVGSKGRQCRGQHIKTFVEMINGIMAVNDNNNRKYNLDNARKKILTDHNGKEFIISSTNKSAKKDKGSANDVVNVTGFKIKAEHYCAELEMLLMYYDYIKKNNYRWYLYTIEYILNKDKID